jgi:uncharacterized protein (UPF0261 family)
MGRIFAEKLNASTGPVTVLLPTKGFSVVSAPGGPFHDAAADATFCNALKAGLRKNIPVIEMDCVVNDPAFAKACAETLLRQITARK